MCCSPWGLKELDSTPVLLPGKSHGQRSLVGYSLWDCKGSDTTERLHFHFHGSSRGHKHLRHLFISYLLLFFGCARSSLLCRLFSSCGECRLLSSWGAWASHWSGFSCCSVGSRHVGFSSCSKQASVVVVHGPSCSVAYRILLDQGLNLCPLHWQGDSYPLHHQGSS